jgi:hypothetical protein
MPVIDRIRAYHQHLLDATQEAKKEEETLSAIDRFLAQVAEAGAEVTDARQRSYLRAFIRYWNSYVYDLTGKFREIDLQPPVVGLGERPPTSSGLEVVSDIEIKTGKSARSDDLERARHYTDRADVAKSAVGHRDQTADELIRLLLLDPDQKLDPDQDPDQDPDLTRLLSECRNADGWNWKAALVRCQQQYSEKKRVSSPWAGYWEATERFLNGLLGYVDDSLVFATDSFENSAEMFEKGYYKHGQGLALMAQGLACQTRDKNEALDLYSQSHSIFQELYEDYERRDRSLAAGYRSLGNKLEKMQAEINEPSKLHFIPIVGKVKAGRPLYMPGEDYQDAGEKVVLNETKYRFLSLKDRKPIPNPGSILRRGSQYFVQEVDGDSMIGAKIYPGDLLLSKQQDAWPEQGEIGVFEEEDSGPIVKRFYSVPQRIRLESANPKHPPKTYDKRSPKLRTVGVVKAILQKCKDQE